MSNENKAGFRRGLWGFKPSEVKEEIARMEDSHQQLIARYQQQLEQMQNQLRQLVGKQAELQKQLHNHQQRENLLADTLLNAQAEANQILTEAQQQAEAIVNSARLELEQRQAQLKTIKQQQKEFITEFSNLYQGLLNNCKALIDFADEEEISTQEVNSDDYQPFIPGNAEPVPEGGSLH